MIASSSMDFFSPAKRTTDPPEFGEINRHVILTGAGFSKNWGGYLGNEMWGAILSHTRVQGNKRLHGLLLRETNFEMALAEVQRGNNRHDQEDLNGAVRDAFVLQDRNEGHKLSWQKVATREKKKTLLEPPHLS